MLEREQTVISFVIDAICTRSCAFDDASTLPVRASTITYACASTGGVPAPRRCGEREPPARER